MNTSIEIPQTARKFGTLRAGLCAAVLAIASPAALSAADGWASQGGGTTGGAGGSTVTVSSLSAFSSAATGTTPMIINVSGMINLGSSASFDIGSNKTIIGVGTNSGFIGDLRAKKQTNIILQNLNFTNPSGVGDSDCITFTYTTRYVVTHCNIYQAPDGAFDQTHACDYGTVSWNKFYYTSNTGHNFVNLIGHSDSNASEDTGHLRITMHHNWYSTLCVERMPRVRFGQVHVYNNYFGSSSSNYTIGVGDKAQILIESNYFDSQTLPWKDYSSSSSNKGTIHWNSGNVFVNTSVPTWISNSSVFTPPYSYSLDAGSNVKSIVMAGAGVGGSSGGGGGTTYPVAVGTYKLKNRATGLMLDNLGSTTDGTGVAQWASGSSYNQRWVLSYTSDGYAKLTCVTGGKCLDSVAHTGNGSQVGQWAAGTSYNQQWTLQSVGSGYFKVINRTNGLCLDTGAQTGNGTIMQFWASGSSLNQQWQFVTP